MHTRMHQVKGKEKKKIQMHLAAEFPNGRPVSLRPEPGLWQGYDAPVTRMTKTTTGGIFNPRLIVLSLTGKKLTLPATLRLTAALHKALLNVCPEPIPEWVSGHAPNGSCTDKPHLALLPLPFVGSAHADGRLMGVALAIPYNIDPAATSRILEPWLRDEQGVPRQSVFSMASGLNVLLSLIVESRYPCESST